MNLFKSRLAEEVSRRTTISVIIMFVGILLVAAGYFGGLEWMLYLGLIVVLVGVMSELVFGIVGKSARK